MEEEVPSINFREYFKDLHDAPAEPIQWIVKDVTPVGLQIFGGAPKSLKSTVANTLPAICAGWGCTSLPPWAELAPGMGGPSLILSGEATAPELKYLYKDAFKLTTAPGTVLINDDPWDFKLDRRETLTELLSVLNEFQPRLCIIDPLRKFHAGDENDAAFVESILYPIRKWAVANSSAVIVVHHARKEPQGADRDEVMDPSNLRGSNAIFGAADSIIMCRAINRDIGHVRVAAIHKRASGWCRDICVGAPGNPGWNARGTEIITPLDLRIEKLRNAHGTIEQIAKQLHLKESEVAESINKMLRNT